MINDRIRYIYDQTVEFFEGTQEHDKVARYVLKNIKKIKDRAPEPENVPIYIVMIDNKTPHMAFASKVELEDHLIQDGCKLVGDNPARWQRDDDMGHIDFWVYMIQMSG